MDVSVILLLFKYMYCQDHVTRNPLQPEGRFSLLKMNNFCGFAVKINLRILVKKAISNYRISGIYPIR
jgi:hypothetical protein